MTDRYNILTVALEKDLRDDDAQALINAIKMMRGVADVAGNAPMGNTISPNFAQNVNLARG